MIPSRYNIDRRQSFQSTQHISDCSAWLLSRHCTVCLLSLLWLLCRLCFHALLPQTCSMSLSVTNYCLTILYWTLSCSGRKDSAGLNFNDSSACSINTKMNVQKQTLNPII